MVKLPNWKQFTKRPYGLSGGEINNRGRSSKGTVHLKERSEDKQIYGNIQIQSNDFYMWKYGAIIFFYTYSSNSVAV